MHKADVTLDSCAQTGGTRPAEAGRHSGARDAALYLAHVGQGRSMRALARSTGRQPSTVMRAVRRVEARRDDPLYDELMAESEGAVEPDGSGAAPAPASAGQDGPPPAPGAGAPSETEVRKAAKRFLRRLSEPGAFLLVKPSAGKGGIFCAANRHEKPIALMPRRMAREFLRREWIRLEARGAASLRYCITDVGRSALRRILAEEQEERRSDRGFAEAPTPFQAQHRLEGERLFADPRDGSARAAKVNLGESPLGWLSRRRGPDGSPFLAPEEVEAGERLRADFEAAEIGPSVAQDWRRFLAPNDRLSGGAAGGGEGAWGARERVSRALSELGPGLADAALRVCCFLEGLESCERRLGWSARSGKVVLKIALGRLARHYGLAPGED
jgi:hypothetical protein